MFSVFDNERANIYLPTIVYLHSDEHKFASGSQCVNEVFLDLHVSIANEDVYFHDI